MEISADVMSLAHPDAGHVLRKLSARLFVDQVDERLFQLTDVVTREKRPLRGSSFELLCDDTTSTVVVAGLDDDDEPVSWNVADMMTKSIVAGANKEFFIEVTSADGRTTTTGLTDLFT